MERKCIICGDSKIYCDVYDSKTIVFYGNGKKSTIAPPKHYCEKHFFEKVWNKSRSSQEGK